MHELGEGDTLDLNEVEYSDFECEDVDEMPNFCKGGLTYLVSQHYQNIPWKYVC